MSATTSFGTFGNRKCIFGIATIAQTEEITFPFSTCSFVNATLLTDASTAVTFITAATAATSVTFKCWKGAATNDTIPAAATGVVAYLIVGPA